MEPPQTVALLDARYQLHERVGEGGMATVYRAEDTFLGRIVAIKLLRNEAEVLASPVRAHREVSALARLNHPSLVTLLEANLAPGDCRYLVMEYIDGPNLSRFLRDGPLSMAQVAHLARELGSGLAVVHAAGLVHRDIKPSNILLAPAPRPDTFFRVKLADFGLAQLADATSVTTPGMVTGTAAYLAPEQVRGEASSAASDTYALGLVLLEALTGERAFGHASGIGAVMARLLEPPAIPSDVDPGWADLVRRMTLSDPTARPTALEVLDTVSTLPASAARPASTAVLPQSVVPADTAPMRRRPVAPTPTQVARRRHRPGAWIGAGAAASFFAVALVCIPGMVAGSTGTTPAPRLVVDRLAEEMALNPALSPATVELASDTPSSNEVVDPGSVTRTDTDPLKVEHGPKPKDDEPKAEPEVEPKPKKNEAVDGPAQREPANGKPADAAKERGNRDR
ncbi:serine/threonine-protein kinase [Microbacterium sp. Root180]|uniref:serine/threonine-protein kinase n=1 Tax=Microbacterium sp. Root180 TaxID=1736483 RepID=UPI0006FF0336|nr:serine/threonine-protein kinase [Microbacterium sp. Root180]KRB35183.1 hypothetical protein ASD93_15440 [Microbacterium sp. Root180]